MADEIISVSLDTSQFQAGAKQAEQSTDALRARIGELLREAMALKAEWKAGRVQDADYAAGKARIGAELSQVQREFRAATAAARDHAAATSTVATATSTAATNAAAANAAATRTATSMAAATSGYRGLGMGILFASQAIEDLQYGFSAVVNNIPMMVMAMGGGPGLAGVISLVSVGVNLLVKHWDDMAAAFGMGTAEANKFRSAMDHVNEQIERFQKTPPVNVAERLQFEQAQRQAQAGKEAEKLVESLPQARTEAESSTGGALKKAITERVGGGEGYEQLIGELRASIVQELMAGDPIYRSEQARQQQLAKRGAEMAASDVPEVKTQGLLLQAEAEDVSKELRRREEARSGEAGRRVGELLGDAFKGRDEDIKALADQLEVIGRGDLAGQVRQHSSYSAAVDKFMDENLERQRKENEDRKKYSREVADFMTDNWKYVQEQRAALRKNSLEIQSFMDEMHEAVLRARQSVKDFAARDEDKKQKEFDLGVRQLGGQAGVEAMLMQAQQAGMGQARGNRLAEAEVARMARMPRQMGGLGYGREEAAEFAEQAVRRANESLESRGWRNVNVEGRLAGRQMDLMERMRSGRARPASRAAKTRKALRARGKVARKPTTRRRMLVEIDEKMGEVMRSDPKEYDRLNRQYEAIQAGMYFDRDRINEQEVVRARAQSMIEGQGARSAMLSGAMKVPSLAGMLGGVAAGAGADRNIASVVSGLKSVADALTEANRKGVPIKLR